VTNEQYRDIKSSSDGKAKSADIVYVGNEYNDFTAYIAATLRLSDAHAMEDDRAIFVFLNDTLLLKHPSRTLLSMLHDCFPTLRSSRLPVLVGRTHPYRGLLQTSPISFGLDKYVSTFMFAVNRSGLELMRRTLARGERHIDITNEKSCGITDVPLKLSEFIRIHVSAAQSANSWKGNRGGAAALRKSAAVLFEQLLSAAFYEEGFLMSLAYDTRREWRLMRSYIWSRIARQFNPLHKII
jgi:hypothetical protein